MDESKTKLETGNNSMPLDRRSFIAALMAAPFAMKSGLWLLDPRPNLPSIVQAVHDGFELSEASNTPVILELRKIDV